MTYTPTNIVQSNEYYPFGLLTQNSWTRDNTTNNFLYNDGSELNTTTAMYDLPFRNYDAALGRFFQVDPLAHRDHAFTPYHYAGNNPIINNDPSGLLKTTDFGRPEVGLGQDWSSSRGASSEDDGGNNGGGGGQSMWDFINSHTENVYDGQFYDAGTQTKVNRWHREVTSEGTWTNPDSGSNGHGNVDYSYDSWGDDIGGGSTSSNLSDGLSGHGGEGDKDLTQSGGLGELSPNSAYTMRGNDVNYATLTKEFFKGTGPEYSGFGADHPMTQDLKNSWIVAIATAKFLLNGGKEPLIRFDSPYGLVGLGMAGTMTEQFIGGARVSIIPTSQGNCQLPTISTVANRAFKT